MLVTIRQVYKNPTVILLRNITGTNLGTKTKLIDEKNFGN